MRAAPMSRNHAQQLTGARQERSRLHRADAALTKPLMCSDEIACLNIGYNDPLTGTQRSGATGSGILSYPFECIKDGLVKSAHGEQLQFAPCRVVYLHVRHVGMQQVQGTIHDAVT